MCSSAGCWGTLSSNFYNPWDCIEAVAAFSSPSFGKGLLNHVFHLIIMEEWSTTFLTCGSLNRTIHLKLCLRVVALASRGSESASAKAHVCWELWGLEWKVTGFEALLPELLLCWELTGPDAGIDRGISTNGDDEKEEANERLVGASVRSALVVFEQRSTSVRWLVSSVEGLNYGWLGPREVRHPYLRNRLVHLWVCHRWIWHLVDPIPHEHGTRPQGISLPVAEMRTWTKGVGFQYTHLRF